MRGIDPLLTSVTGTISFFVRLLGSAVWRSSEPWMIAAESCHLSMRGTSSCVTTADGPWPGLRVRFEAWSEGDESSDRRGTILTVDALDHGLVSLRLARETKATARAKRRGAREIETGDDGFDDDFFVTGPSTAVRAVLDGETRRLLRALLSEVGLEVVDGELRARVVYASESVPLYGRRLRHTLTLLLDAAARLRRPADVAARLAHNATHDPEPGVRRENLMALVRDHPDSVATRETLRAACADADDDVRVRAAIALGEEARPTLVAVARREDGDDMAAGRAITTLGEALSIDDVKAILARALRARREVTASECLASLGRRGEAATVPVLAKVLAVERGELAVAAARALAETGLAAAEGPLLATLGRDLPDLRAAAAAALGRVGSASAVLPLKEAEARNRDDGTRRAARQAVAAIQSRLAGASPGQLSLASADQGALSLAEDQTGRLSLDERDGKP